jgi:hypothetical protein
MNKPTIIDDLVDKRTRLLTFSMFHRSLREFGTDVIGLFNDQLHDQTKQFVVAALVSVREIETTDLSIITAANLKFQSLCSSGREFKLDEYYMLFSRLVVLLNLPEPCTHGEARLFDPDGKIRKTICQDRYLKYINARHDIHFLEKMKHEFYNTFGPNEKYVICMFSHFLPCTDPRHLCSRVLCEFATKHKEQLIVSYQHVWDFFANRNKAWNLMRRNDNIYCMHAKDVCFNPKIQLPGINIEDTIDEWLDDDEDISSFSRLVKRFQKPTLICRENRKEKKKQKSWKPDLI